MSSPTAFEREIIFPLCEYFARTKKLRGYQRKESEAGASKPETLIKRSDARPRDNHPFLFGNPPRRENGSLPRNVCSTGSGPQPSGPAEFGGWDHYSVNLMMSTSRFGFDFHCK